VVHLFAARVDSLDSYASRASLAKCHVHDNGLPSLLYMLTTSDLSSASPLWGWLAKPGIGALVGPRISASNPPWEPGAGPVLTGTLLVLEGPVPLEAVAVVEDAISGENLCCLSQKCLIAHCEGWVY
jgi:hypothetical protein